MEELHKRAAEEVRGAREVYLQEQMKVKAMEEEIERLELQAVQTEARARLLQEQLEREKHQAALQVEHTRCSRCSADACFACCFTDAALQIQQMQRLLYLLLFLLLLLEAFLRTALLAQQAEQAIATLFFFYSTLYLLAFFFKENAFFCTRSFTCCFFTFVAKQVEQAMQQMQRLESDLRSLSANASLLASRVQVAYY
jgi:hypothetical protein